MVYLGQGRASLKPEIINLDTVKYWLRKKDEPMENLTDKDYYTIPELVSKKEQHKKTIQKIEGERNSRPNISLED